MNFGPQKFKRKVREPILSDFLRIYQIYFSMPQLFRITEEFPDYIKYHNEDCTVFFENDVMRKLVEDGKHLGVEYFGVVSHKLKEKLGFTMKEKWRHLPNIANHSTNEFTPELFEAELRKGKPDVMSFQRHMPHDPIKQADRFHPEFSSYWAYIMHQIGYKWEPTHFQDVFYCNYFVAKPEIYEKFVKEMLAPAMDVMKNMPELMGNSRYAQVLPAVLQAKFGITWYPYHPFICERMFSYFVHLHQYKTLHY